MGEILHELFASFGHLLMRVGLWVKDALHPIGWKLFLLYGILTVVMMILTKGKEEKKDKSLAASIGPKLIALIVAEAIILMMAKNVGPAMYIWRFIASFITPAVTIDANVKFPWWWVTEFATFGVVAFLFFVVLELPYMKEQKGGRIFVNLLITYLIASGLYVGVTSGLPQFDPSIEIAEINKPPVKVADAASPEAIKAGKDVFLTYKCFNCHKIWDEGSSDRGPNLGSKQIGLYSEEYILEQIVDPKKLQAAGFEDEKSKTAMPDYFGEDMSKDEKAAIVAFLKAIKDPDNMPVEGKLGEQWTWWDDPKVIEDGKAVFEGANPVVNCSVCHGKDAIPTMAGAFDFRDPNRPDKPHVSTDPEAIKRATNTPLKDWSDKVWIARVTEGVPGSAMAEWKLVESEDKLLKAATYARTFHDPLDKRGGKKKPLPPVKTPESFAQIFK